MKVKDILEIINIIDTIHDTWDCGDKLEDEDIEKLVLFAMDYRDVLLEKSVT